jgi:AraC family transcriptional regulator, transcriptional activator of pobA
MKLIPIRHINLVKNAVDNAENFKIQLIETILDGKNMTQELHRHDYYYILVLKKAEGHHEIDFVPYKVGNNSVFFIRPGQVHMLTLNAGSIGYLMQFNADFYFSNDKFDNQLLLKASNKKLCQLLENTDKLIIILENIFQEYINKKENYLEAIKANMKIFFIELIRNRKNLKISENNAYLYVQERLEEFLELLEIHLKSKKEVSYYSELMNISNYQLNAITKATLGKTSSEIINETLILEAKRNLLATTNQVNQIAFHLGFDDISYFIRFFKKHTGYSPEQFRINSK